MLPFHRPLIVDSVRHLRTPFTTDYFLVQAGRCTKPRHSAVARAQSCIRGGCRDLQAARLGAERWRFRGQRAGANGSLRMALWRRQTSTLVLAHNLMGRHNKQAQPVECRQKLVEVPKAVASSVDPAANRRTRYHPCRTLRRSSRHHLPQRVELTSVYELDPYQGPSHLSARYPPRWRHGAGRASETRSADGSNQRSACLISLPSAPLAATTFP